MIECDHVPACARVRVKHPGGHIGSPHDLALAPLEEVGPGELIGHEEKAPVREGPG